MPVPLETYYIRAQKRGDDTGWLTVDTVAWVHNFIFRISGTRNTLPLYKVLDWSPGMGGRLRSILNPIASMVMPRMLSECIYSYTSTHLRKKKS